MDFFFCGKGVTGFQLFRVINVKGILLNASVENLVTITSLKGMNPQYSFTGSSDDTYGTARVFNLGVTLDL